MGSGASGELTGLDILNVLSFIIGLQNLDLNLTEEDMNKQTRDIDDKANELVSAAITEIHRHLQAQDDKIDKILSMLDKSNNKNGGEKSENYQKAVQDD